MTKTVCDPEYTTEKRTVEKCEMAREQRTREVTCLQAGAGRRREDLHLHGDGPRARRNARQSTYTVCKPVWETKTREYTVCVPYTEQVEKKYTVCVPYTETREVHGCVPNARHKYTVCVPYTEEHEQKYTVCVPHSKTSSRSTLFAFRTPKK